jgi:hypothetical protein
MLVLPIPQLENEENNEKIKYIFVLEWFICLHGTEEAFPREITQALENGLN